MQSIVNTLKLLDAYHYSTSPDQNQAKETLNVFSMHEIPPELYSFPLLGIHL